MKFLKNKLFATCLIVPTSLLCTTNLTCCSKSNNHKLHQLLPYFHYLEFDDYKFVPNSHKGVLGELDDFGCSCIKNGNLFGRNFDYFYDKTPYFVTKVNNNGKHFASVGVSHNPKLSNDDILEMEKSGKYDSILDTIPSVTTDGINENGVVCAMNVCSKLDAGSSGKPLHDSTDLDMTRSVRYVLDYARTAQEAVDLLKKKNLYINDEECAYAIHLMVADKNQTFVLELYNDDPETEHLPSLDIKEKTGNEQIMTNFFVNMGADRINKTWWWTKTDPKPDPTLNKIVNVGAQGTERYQILKDNYNSCNNFSGMYETLKKAWMSNVYKDVDHAVWPSEDVLQDIKTDTAKEQDWESSEKELWDPDRETHGYKWLYKDYHDIMRRQDRELGHAHDVWVTKHTAIFDMTDNQYSMWIISEEQYSLSYIFEV